MTRWLAVSGRRVLWCWLLCVVVAGLQAEPASEWHRTTWDAEPAWEASSAGWTAIVSEGRARLVSLAPAGGGVNLLFASAKASISWGGHRCWLGPQAQWRAIWPPPRDWEASAAAAVQPSGTTLTLTLPHTDPSYPPLTRRYEWQDGVLHCRLSWQGGRYHAIQILQLPQWTIIHARREPRPGLPLGYALLPISGRDTTETGQPMAAGVGRLHRMEITLWHACVTEKIALKLQDLTADVGGGYQLRMRRGEGTGMSAEAPDLGMLTQVYLGDWQNPFVELEQLSPFGSDQTADFEILVEPSHSGSR